MMMMMKCTSHEMRKYQPHPLIGHPFLRFIRSDLPKRVGSVEFNRMCHTKEGCSYFISPIDHLLKEKCCQMVIRGVVGRVTSRSICNFHRNLIRPLVCYSITTIKYSIIGDKVRANPFHILSIPFYHLQGSSKHFIPHSAITCSVQTDDIVACVLLLYNPATRCPLHVHAYRCDSEATAEALNEQLQILINRPENQKRFADLESRYVFRPKANGLICQLWSPDDVPIS